MSARVSMRALTVWQPWASLIAIGAKPYEFRSYRAPVALVGERIGIHAGAHRIDRRELAALRDSLSRTGIKPEGRDFIQKIINFAAEPPLSHFVCTAVLGKPVPANEIMHEFGVPVANDSDRDNHFNWAWPMLDVIELKPPVPARGAQGFWTWEGEP